MLKKITKLRPLTIAAPNELFRWQNVCLEIYIYYLFVWLWLLTYTVVIWPQLKPIQTWPHHIISVNYLEYLRGPSSLTSMIQRKKLLIQQCVDLLFNVLTIKSKIITY